MDNLYESVVTWIQGRKGNVITDDVATYSVLSVIKLDILENPVCQNKITLKVEEFAAMIFKKYKEIVKRKTTKNPSTYPIISHKLVTPINFVALASFFVQYRDISDGIVYFMYQLRDEIQTIHSPIPYVWEKYRDIPLMAADDITLPRHIFREAVLGIQALMGLVLIKSISYEEINKTLSSLINLFTECIRLAVSRDSIYPTPDISAHVCIGSHYYRALLLDLINVTTIKNKIVNSINAIRDISTSRKYMIQHRSHDNKSLSVVLREDIRLSVACIYDFRQLKSVDTEAILRSKHLIDFVASNIADAQYIANALKVPINCSDRLLIDSMQRLNSVPAILADLKKMI